MLAQPQSGPDLQADAGAMAERYPGMRWFTYEPLDRHGVAQATRDAFGRPPAPLPPRPRGGDRLLRLRPARERAGRAEPRRGLGRRTTHRRHRRQDEPHVRGGAGLLGHRFSRGRAAGGQAQPGDADSRPASLPSGRPGSSVAQRLDRLREEARRRGPQGARGRRSSPPARTCPPRRTELCLAINEQLQQPRPHGVVHRRAAGRPDEAALLRAARRTDRSDRRRGGEAPADPRREPGLRRAGGRELRRGDGQARPPPCTSRRCATRRPPAAACTCPRRAGSRRGATPTPGTAR